MTKNKIKVAFLDRDGVINKNAKPHEYITKIKDFKFNKRIFELLTTLLNNDFKIIIITNQRGIARKKLTAKKLESIHNYMIKEFKKKKISILDIFYCPHNENECDCRKPKPGLLIQASKKYNIDLSLSILISDSPKDIEMGKKFDIKNNYLIKQDKPSVIKI